MVLVAGAWTAGVQQAGGGILNTGVGSERDWSHNTGAAPPGQQLPELATFNCINLPIMLCNGPY